jgi:hypothetical protein
MGCLVGYYMQLLEVQSKLKSRKVVFSRAKNRVLSVFYTFSQSYTIIILLEYYEIVTIHSKVVDSANRTSPLWHKFTMV